MSLPDGMVNKSSNRRKLTRKEQRDLDIEIHFMEGVIRRDPKCLEAWRVLSDDYARRGKLDEGLKADAQLARMQPDDPAVLYNLACSHSLANHFEEAATALAQAIARGFCDYKWLMKDPDLANLRKEPLFKKVLSKLGAFQPGIP
jgi:tetratricopeptide (TPR) repeat protein